MTFSVIDIVRLQNVNNCVEMTWKEAAVAYSEVLLIICVGTLRKPRKTVSIVYVRIKN
jgi:hypothetical protein